ncbi:MAG: o-succinylbenzoate synthase [Gemmatimonadota bacterium]
MKLVRLTLREISLTLVEPFQISSGTASARRILLLELEDDDGAVAWSECVAGEFPNYSPETVDTAWWALREWMAPRILGKAVASASGVAPLLEREIRGHQMARASLEMGMWGLEAVSRQLPLARVLGEGRGALRQTVSTGISLGIQPSPEALVERAQEALAVGYRKVKIKIKPGQDLTQLRAVRLALGPTAPLMADANSAYTLDDGSHLAAMDELDLMMLEQPLDRTDLLRHARLQEQISTPICLDESIDGLDRAEDMIALKAGRIVNIKPGRVGGFATSLAIHDLCLKHDVPVWCGGMLESGVGRAYNVALAALPGFTLPGDLSPSRRYWDRDIVDPEWTMSAQGEVHVPQDRPGMGVTVDRDRVEALTVRKEVLGPA